MKKTPSQLFALVLLGLAVMSSPALAAPAPGLTVQAHPRGAPPSRVGQGALQITSSGECREPFDAREADGPPRCPSWPPPDGAWTPQLEVAGSDAVILTFSTPPDEVRVAATTRYARGTTSPDGSSRSNEDVIAPRSATRTGDPSRWEVEVPAPLTKQALSGLTFSVTTRVGMERRSYSLGLITPRFDDHPRQCGLAFFNPGESDHFCRDPQGQGPPPGGGSPRPSGEAPPPTADPGSSSAPDEGQSVSAPTVARRSRVCRGVASFAITTATGGRLVLSVRSAEREIQRSVSISAAGRRTVPVRLPRWLRQRVAGRSRAVRVRVRQRSESGAWVSRTQTVRLVRGCGR